jgi:hypothetical protein
VGDHEYEFGELGALGGFAVETILRRDGKPGAVVVLARRDVPAAPGELRLTAPTRSLSAPWARPALESGSRLLS